MGLDAVEILMGWELAFDIMIADKEAFQLCNTRMAVELIAAKVGATDFSRSWCLSHRAFNRLRSAFELGGISRNAVRPSAKVRHLLNGCRSPEAKTDIRAQLNIPKLPLAGSWTGGLLSPPTVGCLTDWIVTHNPITLFKPGEKWTRAQVRQAVRAIVIEQICAPPDYLDEADFVKNLGLD